MVIQNQSKLGRGSAMPTDLHHTPNVAVHKELGGRLVRAATTASSLEAEQDHGAKKPWGILLLKLGLRVYLNILMIHCSQKFKKEGQEVEKRNRSRTHKLKRLYKVSLSDRVESSRDEESLGDDASKQERRIDAIDADEDIILVNDANKEMFDVDDLGGEEVFVVGKNENVVEEVVNAAQVSTATTTVTITTEEITLAQALEALKTSKPKVKRIVFQEPRKSTTTTTIIFSQQSQDMGKGIMIEEPVKPKKKYQIRLDEEAALKLQAKFDEEERLARERELKKNKKSILP
nr:hypothetical protein [Tanacetum cinerariifolium]